MKPSRLIDGEARARIESAVRAAEVGTSGEIVVQVVRRSDAFAAAAWRISALLAALVLVAVDLIRPTLPIAALFALQLAAVALAHLVCLHDAVRRLAVREVELESAAERGALAAFHAGVANRTEGRTGILIYVSLLEHRVVVLGDEAIDRALGPGETWEEVVALVLAGIRQGTIAEGIIRAVARCGAMLAHPLPRAPHDRDEIVHGLILTD